MARLPLVGGDDGDWGTYLNEFLEVSLDNSNVNLAERGKLLPAAVDAAGAVMNTDTATTAMNFVVDEDNMASDSATKLPTQQSVKAYVDAADALKATDSNVVHIAGAETITGSKTFSNVIESNNYILANGTTILRDNRNNPFLSQSASGVVSNRTLSIGNGTYSQGLFNFKGVGFGATVSGADLSSNWLAFIGGATTGTIGLNVKIEGQSGASGNNNGGNIVVDAGTKTGTGTDGNILLGSTTGNVGIGSSSPSVKLDVTGEIRSSSAGTAPSSVVTVGGTQDLINKTLTSGVINTGVSGTAIDTDVTLAANSDTKLASQKAIKTYVDSRPTGTGDVVGPATATDNAVARFDTTTGKLIQNSLLTVDDTGNVNIPTGTKYKINGIDLAKGDIGLGNVDNTSDITKDAATTTLTNKTLITPVINTGVSGTAIDTDGSLSANSDIKIASQKAVKAYVDNASPSPNLPTGTKLRTSKIPQAWYDSLRATSGIRYVVVIADSFGAFGVHSFPYQLETQLTRMTNTKNDTLIGWRFASGGGIIPRWNTNGGTDQTTTTTAGYGTSLATGQKGTMTGICDGVVVFYRTSPGAGSLIVRDGVGGTVLTTINTNAAASLTSWTSTTLTSVSRTLELEASGGAVVVDGTYLTNGNLTDGIRVITASRSGETSQGNVTNSTRSLDLIQYLESIDKLALVITATGTNDNSGIGWQGQLIDAVSVAVPTVPVVSWIPPINAVNPPEEHEAMKTDILTRDVELIDGNLLGRIDGGDNVHPTGLGHAKIAAQIARILSGDSVGNQALMNAVVPLQGDSTIVGTLTASSLALAEQIISLSQLFGLPAFSMKEAPDTTAEFSIASKTLSAFMGGPAALTMTFTDGITAANGANLYYGGANTLKTDDNFIIGTPGTVPGSVVTVDATQTLTNKRITGRAGTNASSATPTINTDNIDFYSLTAQAVDITSFTTNLTGTPSAGQTLCIAITGTASRAISWGASFEAGITDLPTTTVGTNRLDCEFIWNAVTSKWRLAEVSALDIDGTLSANSDTRVPSQKAVKTYIDSASGSGGGSIVVQSKSSNYTVVTGDDVILVDATSGNINIGIITAVGRTRALSIKKVDSSSNTVTATASGSETIDGGATAVLANQYESITLVSDNTNYFIT